ncbi:MAG: ABC transporter ATP-binding protein [Bryobacteraceae bacterium]
MSDIAIRVDKLGKRYAIGKRIHYRTLRESITDVALAPFRALRRKRPPVEDLDHIWAVRDVSFEIPRGDVVGVIGRNGAGKSTLLKLLSRITEPTEGYAEIRGRVGSLLEVGTGFNNELTGRENVYLNGAILGMRRAEINRKFDEIVAFAEVEKFLDTPVKHYSSGMYMRLAFAVAAHLEPEIMVVDEVLAVGDAAFQKKCLNKMQDVGRAGCTVIFVSHSMPAIARLCPKTILLDAGRLVQYGATHDVVGQYLRSDTGSCAARRWPDRASAPGNAVAKLRSVRVRSIADETLETTDVRQAVGIEMEFEVLTPGYILTPNFIFHNDEGVCLFAAHENDAAWRHKPRVPGVYSTTAWIPGDLLAEGTHFVGASVSTMFPLHVHIHEPDAVAFHVVDNSQGDSARGDFTGEMPGVMRPMLEWSTRYSGETSEAADGAALSEVSR